MPTPKNMNDLTARKGLLIAQSDRHRQSIELEYQRVLHRRGRTQDFIYQNRWWLLGGAAVGGFLLARRWRRGFLGLLPLIPDLLRLCRR
jgi:hypothetical protein